MKSNEQTSAAAKEPDQAKKDRHYKEPKISISHERAGREAAIARFAQTPVIFAVQISGL